MHLGSIIKLPFYISIFTFYMHNYNFCMWKNIGQNNQLTQLFGTVTWFRALLYTNDITKHILYLWWIIPYNST